MGVVIERGNVGEVDAGDREPAATVESCHGREDEGPDRGKEDGRIEWLWGRIVGSLGRRAPERERQLPSVLRPCHHVHRRALVKGHLGRQMRRTAEAVDAEPAAWPQAVRRRAR